MFKFLFSVDFFAASHPVVETKPVDKNSFNSSFDNFHYQITPQKPASDPDVKTVGAWQEKILQGQKELENLRFDTEGFHDKTIANKQQTAMYESQVAQLNVQTYFSTFLFYIRKKLKTGNSSALKLKRL